MEFITLGIGTPASITSFVLMGLGSAGPVDVVEATAEIRVLMPADDHVVQLPDV